MIKDFTPAKSGLSTGVVIKQHLLERNRQRPAQVEISQHYYSGSVYSQQMWDPVTEDTYISYSRISKINGGTGGVFNNLNNLGSNPEGQSQGIKNVLAPYVTQSWTYTTNGKAGVGFLTQSTQDEFYNGELKGSNFVATDGELLPNNPYLKSSTEDHTYNIIKVFGDGSDNRGQESSLFQEQGGQGFGPILTLPSGSLSNYADISLDVTSSIDIKYKIIFANIRNGVNAQTNNLNQVTTIFIPRHYYDYDSNGTQISGMLNLNFSNYIDNRVSPLIKIKSRVSPFNEITFTFLSSSLINPIPEFDYFSSMFHSCSIVGSPSTLPDDGSPVEVYFDSLTPNNTLLLRDFIERPVPSTGSLYLFYDSGSNL
jgi:hypothetical protein